MSRPESPMVNVYRGILPTDEGWEHSHSRGLSAFEHHMRYSFPTFPEIDITLRKSLERAKKSGRKQVIVVDLGAGYGNFTRDFLTSPSKSRRCRGLLRGQSMDSTLRFVSVTDAETEDDFLKETVFPESLTPENEMIQAVSIGYSITTSQSINKLFEHLDIDSVDLVVASNFMSYLRPPLFRAVIQDIIEKLEPKGKFIIYGYTRMAGSYLSIDDDYMEQDETVVFVDPADPTRQTFTRDELLTWGESILEGADDAAIIDALMRISEICFTSGVFGLKDEEEMRENIDIAIKRGKQKDMMKIAVDVLPEVADLVRIKKMKERKDAILEELRDKYAGSATIEFQEEGIRIVKLALKAT